MRLNPKTRFSARLMLIGAALLLQTYHPATASAQDSAVQQLTLSQAIDLALRQNQSLKLAQLDVLDSELKKKIAHAGYFPRLKNESTAFHVTDLQQVVLPAGRPVLLRFTMTFRANS